MPDRGCVCQIAEVSSTDQPARDRDRDAAVRLVEGAWADGQIVEADRDRRVAELRRAETLAEIKMLTHDLEAPDYLQTPAAPLAPEKQPEPAPDRPRRQSRPRPQAARVPGIVTFAISLAVVGVVAAIVVGIFTAVDSAVDAAGDAVTDSPTLAPGEAPDEDEINLFSEDGYADLLADLETDFGSTVVFDAVLYQTYAVLDLPVDERSQRQQSHYWNGAFDDPGSKSLAGEERFDLAELDPAVMIRLVERVRSRVEDPRSWYVIAHAPRPDDQSVLQVYASNEYGESAYVLATLDGTVTYRSDPPPVPDADAG